MNKIFKKIVFKIKMILVPKMKIIIIFKILKTITKIILKMI